MYSLCGGVGLSDVQKCWANDGLQTSPSCQVPQTGRPNASYAMQLYPHATLEDTFTMDGLGCLVISENGLGSPSFQSFIHLRTGRCNVPCTDVSGYLS
jgi:hypothetical protein